MKKILLVFLCLFLLVGCSKEENKGEEVKVADVVKITCADVNDLVSNGAVVIDVRTSDEYATDHLENSINVNSEVIKYSIKNYVSDLNTPIIVYCQSGRRSAESADILVNMGYTTIYDMGAITGCYGEE